MQQLGAEIKAFGGRVFDLTQRFDAEPAKAVRRAAAEASRAYVRALVEADPRRARRALEIAFKSLSDAVRALDGLGAGALANEGSDLCEEVYDLLPRE